MTDLAVRPYGADIAPVQGSPVVATRGLPRQAAPVAIPLPAARRTLSKLTLPVFGLVALTIMGWIGDGSLVLSWVGINHLSVPVRVLLSPRFPSLMSLAASTSLWKYLFISLVRLAAGGVCAYWLGSWGGAIKAKRADQRKVIQWLKARQQGLVKKVSRIALAVACNICGCLPVTMTACRHVVEVWFQRHPLAMIFAISIAHAAPLPGVGALYFAAGRIRISVLKVCAAQCSGLLLYLMFLRLRPI